MRKIHYLNLFAVGLPILLFLAGIINEVFMFWGLLSTMLTGFIQVVLGVKLLIDKPTDKNLKIYLISVILFFLLWIIMAYADYFSGKLIYILCAIPPILAIYLTIIIVKKNNI